MVPVARKNLLADKVRLLISVGGVTLAVMLILVMQSVYQGFYKEAGATARETTLDPVESRGFDIVKLICDDGMGWWRK